jgi:endonuclease/exonuclease/phosphatase family metal-dependent hydrolase
VVVTQDAQAQPRYFSAQRPFEIRLTATATAGVSWVRLEGEATASCEVDQIPSIGPVQRVQSTFPLVSQNNVSGFSQSLSTSLSINPLAYTCGGYPLSNVQFRLVGVAADVNGVSRTTKGDARVIFVQTFRVVNYNIHYGQNAAGDYNLDRTANHIRLQNPDIVVLNEVHQNWGEETNFDNQVSLLSIKLGMPVLASYEAWGTPPWYCTTTWSEICSYPYRYKQLVILSKFPMSQHEFTPYETFDDYRPGLQEVVVDVGGVPLRIGNTHLIADSQVWRWWGATGSSKRQEEVSVLVSRVGTPSLFTILAGDFNAHMGTPEMNIITNAGFQEACQLVNCGNSWAEAIDFIFVWNPQSPTSARFQLRSADFVRSDDPAGEASDHQLKTARFSVTPYW